MPFESPIIEETGRPLLELRPCQALHFYGAITIFGNAFFMGIVVSWSL